MANSHGLTSQIGVANVIGHRCKRPFVDHCLMSFQTGPLPALEGLHSHASELDAFHGLPGLIISLEQRHAMKTSLTKSLQKLGLRECATDAATPEHPDEGLQEQAHPKQYPKLQLSHPDE